MEVGVQRNTATATVAARATATATATVAVRYCNYNCNSKDMLKLGQPFDTAAAQPTHGEEENMGEQKYRPG
jgi:hypothetical protein